ncbi:MAG: L-threonylcarbamoyladenylate synthase [Granulosicoccaceae bacterium]|jgi:tRNA threonylcarbamoyl adenosine modification protein (Sua5/YciO/YrdC/YwlC family)
MSQYFVIHPDNPQRRLIRQAVDIIRDGGLIAYPTDSSYALGCQIGDKTAMERLRAIRRVSKRHNFTLLCRDLSEIATYARVDNTSYRLLKQLTPGPYTFIFKATREVPRRLQHEKRKTIGIRVPDNAIALMLLEELGEPLMSSTLILPGDELPMIEPEEMRDRIGQQLDLIIDGGHCGFEPSTVIDLSGDLPTVIREGRGEVPNLE